MPRVASTFFLKQSITFRLSDELESDRPDTKKYMNVVARWRAKERQKSF